MRIRRLVLLSAILHICAFSARSEEKPWIEVSSPHFRVLTDATAADARRVAFEFEQMRGVFASQYPSFRLQSGAPLLIFAPRDEETAKSLAPQAWKRKGFKFAGFFQQSWEKKYAMVRLDTWGTGAHQVVFHEYTHSLLHINARWLPIWMDEGLAEFFAYTKFEKDRALVGAPTQRFSMFKFSSTIPIETLLKVDQSSPYYHDDLKAQMFYAQSWALIHYMMFGPNMQGGAKLNQFFTKLQQGEEQIKAFQEVFGSLKDMDDAIDQYVRHFAFQVGVIKNPAQMNEKDYVARTMTMAETQAEIGGYHLWTHDLANCTAYVSDALHNDPKLGLAHELQAFLDLSKGQNADSLREFTQAFALDPNLYLSLFAKTMLSPIATSAVPADQEAFKSALRAVIAINPLFAPAYVQLARLAVRQNDLRSALVLSRKAEELEPFRAGYHLQSGQILLRLGQNADAAKFAKYVADRWRGPDHNEAWELWTRVPESQRPPSDPITESAPKDSQRVEGTIKSVSCGKSAPDSDDASQDDQEKDEQKQDSADTAKDTKWSFHLDHDGQALTFHRKSNFAWGFSDSLWYGEDHINMCHNLGGLRAIVHFRPPADSSYSGDVAEIEIRDDLPPAPAPNSPALAAAPAQPSSAAAPPTGASPQ